MRTIERMIDQELICNVSGLIATMAEGYGAAIDTGKHGTLQPTIEQAWELCSPLQDWESAAMEAGWRTMTPEEVKAVEWLADIDLSDGAIFTTSSDP